MRSRRLQGGSNGHALRTPDILDARRRDVAVRRGVWIVLVLIILAVGISAMGLVAMALFVGREPQVSGNSTLVLKIGGDLQEMEPGGVIGQFFEAPPTVRSLVDALRKAKVDRADLERDHPAHRRRRRCGAKSRRSATRSSTSGSPASRSSGTSNTAASRSSTSRARATRCS